MPTVQHGPPNGRSIAFTYHDGAQRPRVWMMNADGTDPHLLTERADCHTPTWSYDGQQVMFVCYSNYRGAIFTVEVETGVEHQLTEHETNDISPVWSPVDNRIAFVTSRDGFQEIYSMNSQTSDLQRLTYTDSLNDFVPVWSPDGQSIAYVTEYSMGDGTAEIHVMNADGSQQRQLTNNTFTDHYPSWSPDGKWLAFYSNRDGNTEIYAINIETGDERRLTTNEANDYMPIWLENGRIGFISDREGGTGLYLMDFNTTGVEQIFVSDYNGYLSFDWRP
jgi:Tol biopolymer transport system component